MERSTFFTYSWHLDHKETECTAIRIYGLNSKNENVCVRINNFLPYAYVQLPRQTFAWDKAKAQAVVNTINYIMKDKKPIQTTLVSKHKLFYAELSNNKRKKYDFLLCEFAHTDDIRMLKYNLDKTLNVLGIGYIKLKLHEHNASPILQLTSKQKLPTAGWCEFVGQRVKKEDQVTFCEHEFIVRYTNIREHVSEEVIRPLVLGFDLEVNSSVPSKMPRSSEPRDKIFQISCVLARQGSKPDTYQQYLLTLGQCNPIPNVTVETFKTEADLILGFTKFVRKHQPNIIIGYNIFNFDLPYMIERAKLNMCTNDFDQLEMVKNGHGREKTISWSSSAYKNQTFQFLEAEGRLWVDLLPIIRRDYKMNNYKLSTIASHFLNGVTKDPLDAQGIFKCYRLGMAGGDQGKKALAIVGKYCLAEGTEVTGIFGVTKIEELQDKKIRVISWDEKTNKLVESEQVNFFNNGQRECIELELEDGTTITCTPDHQISMSNIEWKMAGEIEVGTRVNIGPILPILAEETEQCIMKRLLGYLLTDGHIGKQVCKTYVGNIMDADNIARDIQKLCGIYSVPKYDKNCWVVYIPSILSRKMREYNLTLGNRTKGGHGLPNMSDWTEPEITEFIGGLFGGDGWCPSLSKQGRKFTAIGLTQSRTEETHIKQYMDIIKHLLNKYEIYSTFNIKKRNNLYIGSLRINTYCNEKFVRKIGYRYCYHKTLRASVCVMYQRLKNKTTSRYRKMCDDIQDMISTNISFNDAYDNITKNILYPPKPRTVAAWVKTGMPTGRPNQLSRIFPKADEFIKYIGAESIFRQLDKNMKTYSIGKYDKQMPVFTLPVVSKRNVGIKKVYDIEVSNTHSFLANGVVVHNCVKDSALVVNLFDVTATWAGLTEMAKVCNVEPFAVFTQGQQLRVFSQVYRYCTHIDTVVEKDGYTDTDCDNYVGATVFPPVPGVYDKVLPFDFCSLYPSTIIAHNISWDTFVPKEDYDRVPNEDCHVCEWFDHQGCEHDPKEIRRVELTNEIKSREEKIKEIRKQRDAKENKKNKDHFQTKIDKMTEDMKPLKEERSVLLKSKNKIKICAERKFKFLKSPKGILPTIIDGLLTARKNTKKEMETQKGVMGEEKDESKKESLSTYVEVLNQRQNALKTSANSMYGAMGVKKGYLKFNPGAACTTFKGREAVTKAAKSIQEDYKGVLVYGDTDSNYVSFPHLTTAQECWDYAEYVAEEVSNLFPKPMKIAFENVIYWRFLILTKKRYMSLSCGRDGVIQKKINKKGVLLQRRDNCEFIRKTYASVIMKIFDKVDRADILYSLLQDINRLCSRSVPTNEFTITKAVGDCGELSANKTTDDDGKECHKVGDYKVTVLSKDAEERTRQMENKNCSTEREYYLRCLPAQVQLAERMRERGQIVDAGTRLEYVITKQGGSRAKQYEKVESYDYFVRHNSSLEIDYMYYLKQLSNPMDQVLGINFGEKYKSFMLEQYNYRSKVREKVLDQIRNLFAPKIIVV